MGRKIQAVITRKREFQVVSIFLLLTAAITILVIAMGIFDPKPLGDLYESYPLPQKNIESSSESISWLEPVPSVNDFSLRLTGAWSSGEQDIGYGLVIGDPEHYLVIAVSPLGYMSVWAESIEKDDTANEKFVSWRTWPHIGHGQEQNEIWIDVQEGELYNVWINRELLSLESIAITGREIGYWMGSFGDAATVEFESLDVFADLAN